MSSGVKGNLLIAQGGGPTAVINCSLYGVIQEAVQSDRFEHILGARHGITGVIDSSFIDLRAQRAHVREGLRRTPASALGSCRYKVKPEDYQGILEVLKANDVRCFLYNGGNDSMDTALQVHELAREQGYDLQAIGIPKTIDNDLAHTDRCPGFASAARYVAQAVRDLSMDIRSLPTPVSIFESMGRNAGWLAASSVLARAAEGDGPHLVYLPERPFNVEQFLSDVDDVVREHGWAVVVVSEGLRDPAGAPVYQIDGDAQRDAFGHALPGDVSAYLAGVVASKLGLRCRSEKPGLCGRSSILHASPIDQADAEAVGRAAVKLALEGQSGQMVTLAPRGDADEPPRTGAAALSEIANVERLIPDDWINGPGNNVTEAFSQYARPLIGPPLLDYVQLEAKCLQRSER